MGVRRAVDIVLEIARHENGRRIYTYGPLIHNPQTIELLKSRGITPVDSVDEIADRKNAILIIRAHGIAPAERKKIKESGIKIIDATCPKVGYVQAIIKKHTALGYTVVIVGDKEHPEVDGLLGYTDGRGITIGTTEDVKKMPPLIKVCVVAQTTQDSEDYKNIVDKIKDLYPQAIVFNTICSSTKQRQEEVIAMSREMDAMFVVGGKNSANSRRLADLATKQNTPTFHIETATEIGNISLDSYDHIGISAGASTPNWIIDSVLDRIAEGQNRKLKKVGSLLNLWILAIKTDIYSSLGAGCLSLACMVLQNIPLSISSLIIASFFTYAMHVLNRLISRKPPVGFIGSFREETYLLHEKRYLYSAVVCVLVALILAYNNGIIPFTFLFIIALAGILYNMKLLPGGWRFQSLKDLPGSKNIFMAAAWGTVTAILPALNNNSLHAALIIAFVFTFGVVFIRSAISDILEIQSDKLIGRETIPVLFGKETTLALLKIISLILLVLLTMSNPVGWTTTLSFFLISCILYIWICFQLCDRKSGFSGAVMEGLLETSYIIAGLSVLVWFFAH